jgi:hypothetical protein
MEQRRSKNDAARKGARINLKREECSSDIEQIFIDAKV